MSYRLGVDLTIQLLSICLLNSQHVLRLRLDCDTLGTRRSCGKSGKNCRNWPSRSIHQRKETNMSRAVSIIILQMAFSPNSAFAETTCEFSQRAPRRNECLQRQYGDPEESIYRAEVDAKRDHRNVSTVLSHNEYQNYSIPREIWIAGDLNLATVQNIEVVYIRSNECECISPIGIFELCLFRFVLRLVRSVRTNINRLFRRTCRLNPRRCAAVRSVAVHLRFSQDGTLRPPCRARGGSPMKLCIGSPPIHRLDVFVNGDCPQLCDSQGDSYFHRRSTAARLRTPRRCRSILPARHSLAASTAPRTSSRGRGVPPKYVQWSGIQTDE